MGRGALTKNQIDSHDVAWLLCREHKPILSTDRMNWFSSFTAKLCFPPNPWDPDTLYLFLCHVLFVSLFWTSALLTFVQTKQSAYLLRVSGGASSGKSTFIKQLRLHKGDGFPEPERRKLTVHVYENLADALNILLDNMKHLSIDFDSEYHRVCSAFSLVIQWPNNPSGLFPQSSANAKTCNCLPNYTADYRNAIVACLVLCSHFVPTNKRVNNYGKTCSFQVLRRNDKQGDESIPQTTFCRSVRATLLIGEQGTQWQEGFAVSWLRSKARLTCYLMRQEWKGAVKRSIPHVFDRPMTLLTPKRIFFFSKMLSEWQSIGDKFLTFRSQIFTIWETETFADKMRLRT